MMTYDDVKKNFATNALLVFTDTKGRALESRAAGVGYWKPEWQSYLTLFIPCLLTHINQLCCSSVKHKWWIVAFQHQDISIANSTIVQIA